MLELSLSGEKNFEVFPSMHESLSIVIEWLIEKEILNIDDPVPLLKDEPVIKMYIDILNFLVEHELLKDA